MLCFLADENFNGAIVRGLFRWNPVLDLVTIQDSALLSAQDPEVLEWAASHGRLLLTHDIKTIPQYVRDRVAAGKSMPGVVEVPSICLISQVVYEILLLNECSEEGEWEGQIVRIPM